MIDNILGPIFNKLLNIKSITIALLVVSSIFGYATGDFEKAGKIIS